MKLWLGLGCIILAGIIAAAGFAAGKGPEVRNIDQKISVRADNVTLGDLFRLWDRATGMQSIVPSELAKQKLSVRFTGLSVNDALWKIFDGQPFGFIRIEDQVVVTARSANESVIEPEAASMPVEDVQPSIDEPVSRDDVRMKPQTPQRPNYIPTPFGPIVSPSWNRPVIQLPPVQTAPPPPFFAPSVPPVPPAGAPNGPLENNLFGPLPIYQDPNLPPANPPNTH